jgi:hypothetical protein
MDYKVVKDVPKNANITRDAPLDAKAIPDIEQLLDKILDFLNYINKEDMQKLEATDKIEFDKHLNDRFNDFSEKHYSIFKMLLDNENRATNVAKLFDMLSKLKQVKMGRLDIHQADKDFQEELNNKFLYPKFGGKEQFEKEILKNKHKKN